jgi:hypothetical protein
LFGFELKSRRNRQAGNLWEYMVSGSESYQLQPERNTDAGLSSVVTDVTDFF